MNHLFERDIGKRLLPLMLLPVLLLLFGFSFFHALGSAPLMDPDESRYAEVPREMRELGDFITPHLNYVVYFEKPPLYYWMTAIAVKMFGETEFAERFFSALSGLAGVILVWHVGRRIFGRREGVLAALILGTSIGYLVQARINIIDVFLTCLMTAALGAFYLASRADGPRGGMYFYLFYAFSALAVLAKGLIGILLPAAIILLYMALSKRWQLLKKMRLLTGGPLFILITAPWFIIVSIRNPSFPGFFFIHEHLLRFFTTVHGHYQPFWYFIPFLALGMFPWSCFLPAAIRGMFRERKCPWYDCNLFLGIWAGVIFCFFSLSGSKLAPYILPVFPPTALIIGKGLSGFLDDRFRLMKRNTFFLFVILAAGAVGILIYPSLAAKPRISAMGCKVFALLFLCEALLVSIYTRRANAVGLFLTLGLITYLQGICVQSFVIPEILKKRSFKELALTLKQRARPEDKVFAFGVYTQDLPFYAKRRVALVGTRNELEFGSTQGDQSSWFFDYPQFYELWDSQGPIIVMMDRRDMDTFRKSVKTPFKILGRKENKVLITNR